MLIDEKYRVGVLLEKANESLGAAEILLERRQFEDTVTRCYHAVFFILRAFLKKHELNCEKTSESIPLFKKNFIDEGKLSQALYDDLVFVIETSGFDRPVSMEIGEKTAQEVYERADRFYSDMTDLI
jgi:uncharacterized protein (UPF0332 family)